MKCPCCRALTVVNIVNQCLDHVLNIALQHWEHIAASLKKSQVLRVDCYKKDEHEPAVFQKHSYCS
ncbi:MAG: hypothetical protein LBJ67_06670 [Planctomycetaceae bacterium]|nr:hypothetical protein [Planctomycetaceae bacterium]